MGLGNRGMAFEMLINLANEIYQRGRGVLINKRPNPVKVLKSKGGRVLNGFYEAKNTVEYDGVYKGRAICFVLIRFSKDKSVFTVPLLVIQSYVGMSHQPKRKESIPRADFDI